MRSAIPNIEVRTRRALSVETDPRITGSGQGKADTELSGLAESLVFIGADIPEIRVLWCAIVEHLGPTSSEKSMKQTRLFVSNARERCASSASLTSLM